MKINHAIKVAAPLLLVLACAALVGAFLDPHPNHDLSRSMAGPSFQHFLGCDPYGVDLGRRLLVGAWQSVRVALVVTALTISIGIMVGTTAAFASQRLSTVILRLIDMLMAFPGLLLAILLASIMPHNEATIIFALSVTRWTGSARFCHALVGSTMREAYIEAARANGASTLRLITRHIWPALTGQVLIQASLSMSAVILAEASLSFLGLGGSTNNSSWGKIIAEGREYLIEAPHLSLFPGIIFIASVLAFTLLAEGLRLRLDRGRIGRLY